MDFYILDDSWNQSTEDNCIFSHSVSCLFVLLIFPLLCKNSFLIWCSPIWCSSTNCGKILKEMGIPGHLICFLRNLYAVQEATVRTRYGTSDWFQTGKGVYRCCILPPCLFNLYAEYIMRNGALDKAQADIKIARRNINNLRYADDTTLVAESKELKSLLMKAKEESEKVGLKLSIRVISLQLIKINEKKKNPQH